MSEADDDVLDCRPKREQQQRSLMPYAYGLYDDDDDDDDDDDIGTRYIDVELNSPVMNLNCKHHGSGLLVDNRRIDPNDDDGSLVPTPVLHAASDDEEQYETNLPTATTKTTTTMHHQHPIRRRTCLYIVSAIPLIVSSLALGAVSLSSRGTRSETNDTLTVHDSSGATSALAEITPAATVPTSTTGYYSPTSSGIAYPPPPSPPSSSHTSSKPFASPNHSENVQDSLRPTLLPSSFISPTISPTLETSLPTMLPSSFTTAPFLTSSSPTTSVPSSELKSACKTTGEICRDDKMCCSKRCVANKEEVLAVVGKKDKEQQLDTKEKVPVNPKDKTDHGPRERRMKMERVCM